MFDVQKPAGKAPVAPPGRTTLPTGGVSTAPPEGGAPAYTRYTVARYNRSLRRLIDLKRWYAAVTVILTAVGALLLTGVRVPATTIGRAVQWLTVSWLLPVPLLILATGLFFAWFRYDRFALRPRRALPGAAKPLVIFQITTTGTNVETVLNTARSVLYWTRRTEGLGYRPEVWMVVEGWGYEPNRERLDVLRAEGVQYVVTPTDYRTPKGTTRKGRALQFATERRRELGLDGPDVWVYHQDDETAVGEDRLWGIDEFVREHRDEPSVGCGIILYPQGAEDFRPSQIQEFSRTKDDIRTIYTITSRHNMFSGFHGSHYLARADVEGSTGWDVGPDMNSEDLIFETRVRMEQGPIFHPLKGFAYEQAAFSLRDQLKQRRRWFQGWWRAVLHQPFSIPRRIIMTYGMLVWMGAIFSVGAMVLSWIFGYSAIFVYTGALTGYVWSAMILGYHQGYVLHREYLGPRRVPLARIVANGIVGAFADSLAPWYGTFTRRPRTFQVISKDRRPAPAARAVLTASTLAVEAE
jgi:egghead protein (zeste-white 4 protein)